MKLIAELVEVHHYYAKKIDSVKHKEYWEMLKELGLYTLERRREMYAVLYTWMITEGLAPNF